MCETPAWYAKFFFFNIDEPEQSCARKIHRNQAYRLDFRTIKPWEVNFRISNGMSDITTGAHFPEPHYLPNVASFPSGH
jgi:hypothetical protein